jgi:hypothetical protein
LRASGRWRLAVEPVGQHWCKPRCGTVVDRSPRPRLLIRARKWEEAHFGDPAGRFWPGLARGRQRSRGTGRSGMDSGRPGCVAEDRGVRSRQSLRLRGGAGGACSWVVELVAWSIVMRSAQTGP